MAIAKSLVDLHGGSIAVESQGKSCGSTDFKRFTNDVVRIEAGEAQFDFAGGDPSEIEQIIDQPRLEQNIPADDVNLFGKFGGNRDAFSRSRLAAFNAGVRGVRSS